jgi:hypothetical protein
MSAGIGVPAFRSGSAGGWGEICQKLWAGGRVWRSRKEKPSLRAQRSNPGGTPARGGVWIASSASPPRNPDLRRHYDSLRERGKKPIVAIIAIARKLITIINARIRDAFFPPTHQLC